IFVKYKHFKQALLFKVGSILKLLPFQGDRVVCCFNPGRCPGLGASAPSGRIAAMSFCLSGH
ncbi:MAG: hypothetical protein ACOCPC_01135, partial [Segatella copri]